MWVSVWWKTRSQSWEIYTSHIHWVTRGTGTPKNRDEVNRREVWECDEWVCDLEAIDASWRFKLIRNASVLGRMLPTFGLYCQENASGTGCWITQSELLNLPKKRPVSRWVCKNKRHTNSLCKLPDVLGIPDIKEIVLEVLLLQSGRYCQILSVATSLSDLSIPLG